MTDDRRKKPRYVLVIESNPAHAELLTDILDRHFAPIVIHIVDTIDAAFEFLDQTRYNLVLTDSSVGNVPVLSHIKKIRSHLKNMPIIVVTGSGDESLAAQMIKQGVNEYLVKTRETVELLPSILEKYLI